jgi:hypothetical protein
MARVWIGVPVFLVAVFPALIAAHQMSTPQHDPAPLAATMALPLNASQIDTIALSGPVGPATGSQDPAGDYFDVVHAED